MEAPHFRETTAIPKCFHLAQTLDCGQAFRWRPADPQGPGVGRRRKRPVPAAGGQGGDLGPVLLPGRAGGVLERVLRPGDGLRRKAPGFVENEPGPGPGRRLRPGDPHPPPGPLGSPVLLSHLPRTNHIPRIKGIIERLCQLLGEPIGDTGWHSFPGPEKLSACSLEDLAPLRAGFRAKYLLDAARKVTTGEVDLDRVARSPGGRGP